MKRLFVLLLTLVFVFTVCACRSRSNDDENSSSGDYGTESEIDLTYTFEDPSVDIAFDYPDLECIEEGSSQIFKHSRFVIAYTKDFKAAELQEIPTELIEKCKDATDAYLPGTLKSFKISNSKTIEINGTGVLMIKGLFVSEVSTGRNVNLPMQGYTFAMDGAICQMVAVLYDEATEDDLYEMQRTVEAMIGSLRADR